MAHHKGLGRIHLPEPSGQIELRRTSFHDVWAYAFGAVLVALIEKAVDVACAAADLPRQLGCVPVAIVVFDATKQGLQALVFVHGRIVERRYPGVN